MKKLMYVLFALSLAMGTAAYAGDPKEGDEKVDPSASYMGDPKEGDEKVDPSASYMGEKEDNEGKEGSSCQ